MNLKFVKKSKLEKFDVLAFGPHPDDVEFGCSGMLASLAKSGKSVAIVDMSLAELSSNGTTEERLKESKKSAEIIGAKCRINLEIANNRFYNSKELQDKLIYTIRLLKPEMILIPFGYDRHPDHEFASHLVREAVFTAGLVKYELENMPPHRPTFFYYYELWEEFEKPSFYFDISNSFKSKMKAIQAYESQFVLKKGARKTIDNAGGLFDFVEARALHYGFKVSVKYAEAYKNVYNEVGIKNFDSLLPNLF